jgi:putative transcriptional regulator
MSKLPRPPAKGVLLVSEPFLNDPNFRRSVVLLTEHNGEGSIGFILNRPISFRVNEIMEDFPEFDAPVFLGGPVQQDSLHFIHRVASLAEEGDEIAPGVFWGGDFERLKSQVQAGLVSQDDVRFFIGYSGWGPEQLEEEMAQKAWIISPPRPGMTFADDPKGLWRDILQAMGGKYKSFSNYPEDPSLN